MENILEKILKNGYQVLILKNIFIDGTDSNLPGFIDRGKELKELHQNGLFKYGPSGEKKHQHYKPEHLTKEGEKVCEKLRDQGYFILIEKIRCHLKEEFDKNYTKEMEYLNKTKKYQEYDKYINSLGIPKRNESRTQNQTTLTITDYDILDDKPDSHLEILFFIQIKCTKCKNIFEFPQKLVYKENTFLPYNFDYPCLYCNYIFYSDSFFTQFGMYENDE